MALIDPTEDYTYDPTKATPNSGVSGYGTPQTSGTSAPTPQPASNRQGVSDAYRKYLGRDLTDNEYGFWSGNTNYEQGIQNSPEAQQYAKTGQGGNFWQPGAAPAGFDAQKWQNPTQGTTHKYTVGRILAAGGSIEHAAQAVGGKVIAPDKIQYPDGFIADVYQDYGGPNQRVQYTQTGGPGWQGVGDGTSERAQARAAGGGAGGAGTAGSVFSDPATSQWEQLIRQLTERLNQPVPAATQELQQTQALDPLERQRTQQKQQTALQLSQRGITQGSGVFTDAMANIDRQFNELRTRTQAGFANQGAQTAEQRAMQGVNLFGQIPQYQDERLRLAQGTMMNANPYQAISLAQQFQQMQNQNSQYNNAQDQQFYQGLLLAIEELFRDR